MILPGGADPVSTHNYVWDTMTLMWVAETQPSGGGGGGAVTIADGADVTQGSKADVPVTDGGPGTISAKLAGLLTILNSAWSAGADSDNLSVSVQAGLIGITDGANSASVKGGGVLPVPAVDQALVVTQRDPLTVGVGSWLGSTAPAVGQKAAANSLPVVLAADQTSISDSLASGNITGVGQFLGLSTFGRSTMGIDLSGAWTGTVVLEGSVDGTTFYSLNGVVTATGLLASSFTTNLAVQVDCAGLISVRIRSTAFSAGLLTVFFRASIGVGPVKLAEALPPGTNSIGAVTNTNLDVALSTRLADSTFTTRINTQGQKAMAASTPVVIALDQSAVPISGTVTVSNPSTQYTEDVASAGGESLTLAGAARSDYPMVTQSADGDYANLKTDSVGRLRTNTEEGRVVDGTFYALPLLSLKLDELIEVNKQVASALVLLLNVTDRRSNYQPSDLTLFH
jgi:hypothetical protein